MTYSDNVYVYGEIGGIIVALLCATFLLILLRPLYKFCKERTALFILFSKTCINCFAQFVGILQIITNYIPFNLFYLRLLFIWPISQFALNASYFHMTGLALNRFHSVFFLFSYQNLWKLKNIKYFIAIIWLISILWTAAQYYVFVIININHQDAGIFSILNKGILTYNDLPLLLSFSISTMIYASILAKFFYNYKYPTNAVPSNNENTAKDRVLIMIICLISITPCPLLIGMFYLYQIYNDFLQNSKNDESIQYIIFYIIYNACFTLIQFIEEICLFIISKDFRKLVKTQFVKNTQTNVVSNQINVLQYPIYVLQTSQHFNRTNRFHVQTNNS